MEYFKKLAVWGMLATFPAAVYSLQSWQKLTTDTSTQVPEAATVDVTDLTKAVDMKIKKIAEIDIKILSTKGEVLKYQEQRQVLVKELEKIQERIKPHLRQKKEILK